MGHGRALRLTKGPVNMKPMLCRSIDMRSIDFYLDDDEWFAQQKLDGDRLLVHVRDGEVMAINRDGRRRTLPVPAAILRQFAAFPGEFIFDGELMASGDYHMFDLPVAADLVTPQHPYSFRFAVLEKLYAGPVWRPQPCVRLLPLARNRSAKRALVTQLAARGAEGLIFRHVDGLYRPGRRSDRALKAKFLHTVDVVVDQVRPQGRNNCTFRLFRDGELVPAGSCSLDARPRVHPGDVIEVRYLHASDDDQLYQPVMLRVRHDKSPVECNVDQLRYTDRTVIPVQPYVRQRRRSRASGAIVEILDTCHPDTEFERQPGEGRWMTICEHGSQRSHRTLRLARQGASLPGVWCPQCAEAESVVS